LYRLLNEFLLQEFSRTPVSGLQMQQFALQLVHGGIRGVRIPLSVILGRYRL